MQVALGGPLVDPASVGQPWSDDVSGVLQFRGNPTHTWYGEGPVPKQPRELWRFPAEPMCKVSTTSGKTLEWCGTGWTGQPVVWDRPDGVTEVIFGAYDAAVHFLDGATGKRTRPDLPVGDIIKGTVSLDPDGWPLLYVGGTDSRYRVVALDRDAPEVIWDFRAEQPDRSVALTNDDFDGNSTIAGGKLFIGAEDGHLYVWKLNRAKDEAGRVVVAPERLLKWPTWKPEWQVGTKWSTLEGSVALRGDVVYGATTAGRVFGLDVSGVDGGEAPLVFDWWGGDDIDASLVLDGDGGIYVAAELERNVPRSLEVGQLVKLDPSRPEPRVWGIKVPGHPDDDRGGGMWATPALHRGVLYAPTHSGRLLAVDTGSGEIVWEDAVGLHAWASPSVVDDVLVVSVGCFEGARLRGYDVSDPRKPKQLWETKRPRGCIESTPTVWKGRIYVGDRSGYFAAFGDLPTK